MLITVLMRTVPMMKPLPTGALVFIRVMVISFHVWFSSVRRKGKAFHAPLRLGSGFSLRFSEFAGFFQSSTGGGKNRRHRLESLSKPGRLAYLVSKASTQRFHLTIRYTSLCIRPSELSPRVKVNPLMRILDCWTKNLSRIVGDSFARQVVSSIPPP